MTGGPKTSEADDWETNDGPLSDEAVEALAALLIALADAEVEQ